MRTIPTIIFVLLTLNLFSQQKEWTGDTNFWYNYQKKINDNLDLKDLSKSKLPFAFRISALNTILEIWTEDGKTFLGQQIVFTTTSKVNSENLNLLSRKEMINKDTTELIENMINYYELQNLQIQDSIEGWGHGFDGTIFLIEFATPMTYSFKSYWTPTAFPSVPEAVKLSEFISKIDELLKLNQKFDNFIKSLPTDMSYRYGNAWTTIRPNKKIKKKKKNAP